MLFGASANEAFTPYVDPRPLPAPDPASRLKPPALNVTFVPCCSRGDLVMMLTTPVNAFAPHTADAGPRMTSICLTSPRFVGTKSHRTRPKKSRYTERPSTSTSCEFDSVEVP